MINAFIAMVVCVMSFQIFTTTYQLSGINKTLINMPKSIIENSIPLEDEENNFIPTIDKTLLQENANEYFEKNLSRYTNEYKLQYLFYDKDTNRPCIIKNCSGVRITLTCKILQIFNYSQTMYYEIIKGELWTA